jgi:glyoxylase-like metal-dependent hydrolase (beta-lactamase superfamily II)
MDEVADGVWLLPGLRGPVNAYLMETVLIDAGGPWDAGYLLETLDGLDVQGHALTHAHPDHMGSSHEVCEALGVPFWVGRDDVSAAEDPGTMAKDFARIPFVGALPRNPLGDLLLRATSGPGHPVDHGLEEGDEIDGFIVLDVPGHTAGHVAFWRESDRTLIAGDVLWNFPRLMPPPGVVNVDGDTLRTSIAKIAALQPEVVLFGHGPPLRDPERLIRLAV